MHQAEVIKKPAECSETEPAEFEHLVRRGFAGSDAGLPGRVRGARLLAFHYGSGREVVAIAGLKEPERAYVADVFEKAGCDLVPDEWKLELGWVFVRATHRRARIASFLGERLLERVEGDPVYATTRSNNIPMIRILESLGFRRTGMPFLRRTQELVLFIRDPGRRRKRKLGTPGSWRRATRTWRAPWGGRPGTDRCSARPGSAPTPRGNSRSSPSFEAPDRG